MARIFITRFIFKLRRFKYINIDLSMGLRLNSLLINIPGHEISFIMSRIFDT